MGSLRLSIEVWRDILESDGLTQADVARICLVSRIANVALRPFLYRRIALRDIGADKLQESLKANPSLGRHIEEIVWDFQAAYKIEERFQWTEYDERFEPDNFTRLIEDRDKQISIGMDILAKCTELRTLRIIMDNELNRLDGDMDILEGAVPGKGLPYLNALLRLPFAERITTLSIHQTDYVFSSTEPLARWIPNLINLKELTLRNCTLPAWSSASSTASNESFSSPDHGSDLSIKRISELKTLHHLVGICVAYDTERDTPPEAPFPLDCLRTPNLETLRYHLPTPFESPDEWESFRENYIFGIESLGCGQSVKHLIIGLRHAYPAEERARYWSVIAAACPNAECMDLQFDGFINTDGTDLCVKIADWSQNKKLRHMLLRMTPGLNMVNFLPAFESMASRSMTVRAD
ncbi:MAG: hypothetical protein CYPHOPRED_002434 [Cyphobasidiales sp. Tagirdzhanova-0007]|nr:MAG: hypothetical protein CYPHOPRED_002434 [Cyphobasidiales sp. Tagirdzhanova-0007]